MGVPAGGVGGDARGESGIVQVGTGAGKTYAAYIGALAELIDEIEGVSSGVRERNTKRVGANLEDGVGTVGTPVLRGRGVSDNEEAEGIWDRVADLYLTPLRAVCGISSRDAAACG